VICAAVLLWASILALPAAQTLDGMWEGKMESGPGASWRVDFDGQLWSLNGGPPLPLTLVPSDDPATVQFDVSVGGNTLRYTGKRDGSRIAGTIAKINLTLTRLPDDTPRFAARKRAPFPGTGPRDAAAITKARALVAELVRAQEIPGLFQRYVPEFPKKPWPITTRQLAAHTAASGTTRTRIRPGSKAHRISPASPKGSRSSRTIRCCSSPGRTTATRATAGASSAPSSRARPARSSWRS
jgi:hypothetical protein